MPASLRMEIFPSDRESSVDFYVRVLRFEASETGHEGYTTVRRDGVLFGISPRTDDVETAARRPPTGTEIVVEVDDIDEEWEFVQASGWPIDAPLMDRPWGLRDFRIVDPDGYYLRLTNR